MTVIGDLENEEVRSGAIKDPTGIPASPFGSVRIPKAGGAKLLDQTPTNRRDKGSLRQTRVGSNQRDKGIEDCNLRGEALLPKQCDILRQRSG
eukprot:COSAG06_NODE_32253_length_509_cov_0.700000_1_plen_93_part_00